MTGFGRILDDLNGAGIRYVLIGGIALIRHGVVRAHGDLDLLSEKAAAVGFTELLDRADTRRVDGIEAPICSLADLVAMKRSVGRERDRVDLADLESAHGDLPDSP